MLCVATKHLIGYPIVNNIIFIRMSTHMKKNIFTSICFILSLVISPNAIAGADYAIEIIDHLGDGKYLSDNAKFRNHEAYAATTIAGIRMASNLLKTDGLTVGTTIENSVKLAGYLDFGTTPVVIDEDVSGLTLDFNTSRSVSIDFAVDNGNDLIYGAKVGADPFVLRITPTRAN
jgi:hypothetical protein